MNKTVRVTCLSSTAALTKGKSYSGYFRRDFWGDNYFVIPNNDFGRRSQILKNKVKQIN